MMIGAHGTSRDKVDLSGAGVPCPILGADEL